MTVLWNILFEKKFNNNKNNSMLLWGCLHPGGKERKWFSYSHRLEGPIDWSYCWVFQIQFYSRRQLMQILKQRGQRNTGRFLGGSSSSPASALLMSSLNMFVFTFQLLGGVTLLSSIPYSPVWSLVPCGGTYRLIKSSPSFYPWWASTFKRQILQTCYYWHLPGLQIPEQDKVTPFWLCLIYMMTDWLKLKLGSMTASTYPCVVKGWCSSLG